MSTIRLRFHSLLFLFAVLILWSCTPERKGLELVPSTADYVATVNINEILTNLGVGEEANVSAVTLESEKLLSDYARLFVELRGSCNLNEGLCFGVDGKRFITLVIDNETDFKNSLSTNLGLKSTNEGGYDLYPYQGGFITVASKGNQCWILERGTSVADLESSLKQADKGNITIIPFISEYLERESTANVAGRSLPGLTGRLNDNHWFTCRADLRRSEMTLECARVDSMGKSIPTRGLTNTQPDFLNYLPFSDRMTGLAAVGINGLEIDWEKSCEPLISLYGLQARGLMDYLIPFLGQIDGPVAIGVTSTAGVDLYNPSPSQVSMAALVHMNRQGIKKSLQTIRNQLSWFGNKLTTNPDGSLRLDMGDFEAYACEIDGYLAVSNYPIEKTDSLDRLSNIFAGECKGGLYIHIASLKLLAPDCPEWGMTVTGQYRDDILRMTVKLTDTDAPILKSLLQI